MSVWAMVIITAVVVLLPVVLMFAFNATDQADSRGRRISRRWRVRTRNSPPAL
jgi:hypothetical protein